MMGLKFERDEEETSWKYRRTKLVFYKRYTSSSTMVLSKKKRLTKN
jgi:hypothetical protein